jgi:hypothetical protein
MCAFEELYSLQSDDDEPMPGPTTLYLFGERDENILGYDEIYDKNHITLAYGITVKDDGVYSIYEGTKFVYSIFVNYSDNKFFTKSHFTINIIK